MSVRGWVYVIDNAAMPGIVKVGYSTKDPVLRARELAGTGSPHAFRVVFDVLVENPRDVERKAHAMLSAKREGKEWFRCTQSEAVAALRACAKRVLLERGEVDRSVLEDAAPAKNRVCGYYGCCKPATSPYKDAAYCAEHGQLLRKQRFEKIRRLRDG